MKRAPGPVSGSPVESLKRWAADTPRGLAYSVHGDRVTFGDLWQRVRRFAGGLRSIGLDSGDSCVLALEAGIDYLTALYAVQALGARAAPINPELPPALIARRAASLGAKSILLGPRNAAWEGGAEGEGRRTVEAWALESVKQASAPPIAGYMAPPPDAVAFQAFSSGTTGDPKAVDVLHRNLSASLETGRQIFSMTPADVMVSCTPHYLAMGVIRFIFFSMHAGCPLHLVSGGAAGIARWLRTIGDVSATFTGGTDYTYRMAARMVRPETVDLRSLRIAFSGGEASLAATIRAFEERFGAAGAIRPSYGLTEATNCLAHVLPGEVLRFDGHGRVSPGRPVPGVEIRIANDEGEFLPPGAQGEILARGEQVSPGYHGDPEGNKRLFREGWLRTGDYGVFDGDGFLYVVDRMKHMIKRAGASISPREVEAAAECEPRVSVCAAVGLPGEGPGGVEDVVVVCETRAEDSLSDSERATISRRVAAEIEQALGQAPQRVIILPPDSLPRNVGGKVNHAELRRRLMREG